MTTPSGSDRPAGHGGVPYPPPDPTTAQAETPVGLPPAGEVRHPPPGGYPAAGYPAAGYPSGIPPQHTPADHGPAPVNLRDQAGQPASFAPRAAAFAVDGMLAVGAGIAVAVVVGFAVRYITFFAPAVRVFAYGAMIGVWLFQNYVQGETGQTIGKRMVGTRLVNMRTGLPIGPSLSIRRGLLHALDALPCGFGFFQVLWHTRRQTFADVLTRSVVVHS